MRGLFAAFAVTLAGLAAAQPKSEWESRNEERLLWSEENVVLPAFPSTSGLLEFDVSPGHDFKFYVDPATLSVGEDRVVRYALIARSPSGVENVRFEGLRCATGEYRIYAVGRPDGRWSVRTSGWRPYERATTRSWHDALSRHYFCPNGAAIGSAEEGMQALKQGGHPAVSLERR